MLNPWLIISPAGQTPTGEKLSELLEMYIPRLEDKSTNHKPITIIVITDGVPSALNHRLLFEIQEH